MIRKFGWNWVFVVGPVVCIGFVLLAHVRDSGKAPFVRETFLVLVFGGAMIVGCALYALRRSHRVVYGLAEIGAAIGLLYFALFKVFEYASTEQLLQLAAALYVLVRGLDNVGEGLKNSPKHQLVWDRWFPTRE